MTLLERKCFHAKAKSVRSVTASHYKEVQNPLSGQEVLNKFKLLAPQTMISMARVNLSIRLVAKGSFVLKREVYAARDSTKSWLAPVEQDLMCLATLYEEFAAIGSTESWIRAIECQPIRILNLVKAVCKELRANQLITVVKASAVAPLGEVLFCRHCPRVPRCPTVRSCHEYKSRGVKVCSRR